MLRLDTREFVHLDAVEATLHLHVDGPVPLETFRAPTWLRKSVAKHGVLVPVLIAPTGDEGVYFLVDGRLRLAAARATGKQVPAVVLPGETVPGSRAALYLTTALHGSGHLVPTAVSAHILFETGQYTTDALTSLLAVHPVRVRHLRTLATLVPDPHGQALLQACAEGRISEELVSSVAGTDDVALVAELLRRHGRVSAPMLREARTRGKLAVVNALAGAMEAARAAAEECDHEGQRGVVCPRCGEELEIEEVTL